MAADEIWGDFTIQLSKCYRVIEISDQIRGRYNREKGIQVYGKRTRFSDVGTRGPGGPSPPPTPSKVGGGGIVGFASPNCQSRVVLYNVHLFHSRSNSLLLLPTWLHVLLYLYTLAAGAGQGYVRVFGYVTTPPPPPPPLIGAPHYSQYCGREPHHHKRWMGNNGKETVTQIGFLHQGEIHIFLFSLFQAETD